MDDYTKASTSTSSSERRNDNPGPSSNQSAGPESNFECNICLDTAKDAVVSVCGHLFW